MLLSFTLPPTVCGWRYLAVVYSAIQATRSSLRSFRSSFAVSYLYVMAPAIADKCHSLRERRLSLFKSSSLETSWCFADGNISAQTSSHACGRRVLLTILTVYPHLLSSNIIGSVDTDDLWGLKNAPSASWKRLANRCGGLLCMSCVPCLRCASRTLRSRPTEGEKGNKAKVRFAETEEQKINLEMSHGLASVTRSTKVHGGWFLLTIYPCSSCCCDELFDN